MCPARSSTLPSLALLTIAVAAAALAIGAARQVAPPFGAARNGLLAFDQSGSIIVARPGSAEAPAVLATFPGAFGPVFAPDGAHLAFYAQQDGVDTLFVARPDGSEPVAVSQGRALGGTDLEMRPSWSPDSSRIAFTGFSDGDHHLYVANVTESSSIELGAAGQSRIDPAWSPDGEWIAFQAPGTNKISQQGLYLIRPDGTDEHLVASTVGGSFTYRHPQWLPDPDRQVLAYPIGQPSAYDIAVFDVASNTETVVSREPAAELWPVWSPDGTLLAWNASDAVVRIARADGTVVQSDPGCHRLRLRVVARRDGPLWLEGRGANRGRGRHGGRIDPDGGDPGRGPKPLVLQLAAPRPLSTSVANH